jgi:hypothetical protein
MLTQSLWRWTFVVAIILTLVGLSGRLAFGAPASLDCRYAAISAPTAGSTVSGPIDVRGRALILDFQFYKVEYGAVGSDTWVLIGPDVTRQTVENGKLATWQTTIIPDGQYRLRLHVVDPTGNYCEVIVSPIRVLNARPTSTPEPSPTETVELTVVPPGPTLTIAASVPIEVAPVPSTPGAVPSRSLPFALPATDVAVTIAAFCLGAMGLLVAAVAVGLVLLARNVTRR